MAPQFKPGVRLSFEEVREAMKTKSKHVSLKLPPCRLYLEDIIEIESLFKQHCESYAIETDKYEYENLAELMGTRIKSVDEFEIGGRNPNIRFTFHRSGSSITSYAEKGEIDPFAYLLRDKITSKSSKLIFMAKSNQYPLLIYICATASAIMFINSKAISTSVFLLLMIAYFVYSFLFQLYLDIPRHTIIYFCNKGEGGGFISRNKDKIILIVLSAIIGSIVTLIVNYLIKFL